MTTLPPVISQVTYPEAGDVDDCFAVATIWAATAADPSARRPGMTEFRAAAGNPDKPGPTGGNLDNIMSAVRGIWPELTVMSYRSRSWLGFVAALTAGKIASLAVLSSELPAPLRFGFGGSHQVGVICQADRLWLANPLARDGAAPLPITEAELRRAAEAVAGGEIQAALFTPIAGGEMLTAPTGITSPQRVRIVRAGDLLDVPGGKRIAGAPVRRTYPYIGTTPGYKAVLVQTAIPYPDGKSRPTVLFVKADMAAIEDVLAADPSPSGTTVVLMVNGKAAFSQTFGG